VSGDFNKDGHLDLAVAVNYPPTKQAGAGLARVLLGDGHGSFTPGNWINVNPGTRGAAVADVDGDTNPDLVFLIDDPFFCSGVEVLKGLGNGTFDPFVYRSTACLWPGGLAVGKFTDDDVPDVVVSQDFPGNGVALMGGSGSDRFTFLNNYPGGGGSDQDADVVVAADFNGDGALDLAVGHTDGVLSVLMGGLTGGRRDGTFGAPTEYPIGGVHYSIAVADFTGDGNLDLAVSTNQTTVGLLLGDGRGGFRFDQGYRTGNYAIRVAAGDFNSDGKPDLAAVNFDDGTVSILLNQYPWP
jgi:hypothetical protein